MLVAPLREVAIACPSSLVESKISMMLLVLSGRSMRGFSSSSPLNAVLPEHQAALTGREIDTVVRTLRGCGSGSGSGLSNFDSSSCSLRLMALRLLLASASPSLERRTSCLVAASRVLYVSRSALTVASSCSRASILVRRCCRQRHQLERVGLDVDNLTRISGSWALSASAWRRISWVVVMKP
jgi:hypothetical protein